MDKFTPYALKALPTTGIDVNGIYFIKPDSEPNFQIYIRKKDNSDWIHLGITNAVKSVNSLTGDVKIDLDFTGGKLKITAVGTGSQSAVTEINLDARYRKLADNIHFSEIIGVPNYALDADVVHKEGTETISGNKTFTIAPTVPLTPSANAHASSKKYVDDGLAGLQNQINNIETTLGTGLLFIGEIDCSTNPNFPTNTDGGTKKGNLWIVSKAGKIGGTNGRQVDAGNLIIAKVNGAAGGDWATSNEDWVIIQSDLDQATELVAGFAKIATNAQTDAGTDDSTIITPKKLQRKVDDLTQTIDTSGNSKYVRYDTASQGLNNSQKTNARGNIGAADDAAVVKLTGNQTVAGTKTFSSIPVLPSTNPTADNQATRKKYVDDTIKDAVAWGGSTGKEW